MSKYRHIIWDWNGTLLNDAWLSVYTVNELLSRRDLPPLTEERYAEIFGWPLEEYYAKLGFDFDDETFAAFCEEWFSVYQSRESECTLRPQAKEVLQQAQDLGLGQSVLSAYQHDPLEGLITQFGIGEFFDPVIGLRPQDGLSKVARGKEWFQSTGYGPHEAIFVGDTLHDVEVAEAIGVDCMLVFSGHQSAARMKAAQVPVVDCLSSVLEALS